MDTLLCIVYRGQNYHCLERDLMGKRDEIIHLIIEKYIIYRDYIKNFEKFLNMIDSKWPKWEKYESVGFVWAESVVYVEIHKNKINVYENDEIIYHKKITNQKNPEFIEFINRRFLLKNICEKFNVPKDIHRHLINFF